MAKLNAIQTGSITKPSVSGNFKHLNSKIFNFDSTSFTKDWYDPMQGSPGLVTIKSLPYLDLITLEQVPLIIGSTFEAITAQNIEIRLGDEFAIHNGVLYEFTQSIDAIIAEQLALGRRLIENWQGVLIFVHPDNLDDQISIEGTAITEEQLDFEFTVQSTASGLHTNPATFTIIPWENVNLKPNYILRQPGGEVDNPVVGFVVSDNGTTRTAVIRLADNTELSQSWPMATQAVVTVEDLNTAPERKVIASINTKQIFETLTALVQPTISGTIITWKYRNENNVVQEVTLDLLPLLPEDTDINIESITWDINDDNILNVRETDGTTYAIDFSKYKNSAVVKEDGSVDLFQGNTLILTLSKVAITNNYNDLINLPIISGQLPPGRKDQLYFINKNGTNEVIPDWLMKKGIIVQTEREYNFATTQSVTLEEVFKTWEMFSHFDPTEHWLDYQEWEQSSPPDFPALTPDDTQASTRLTPEMFYGRTLWKYDPVNDWIYLTQNVHPYTGFISPREFGNYIFEATFSSPAADNDWLALVIGFWKDPITGYEHTLSVVRTYAIGSLQDTRSYYIVKNFTQLTSEIIVDGTPLAPAPAAPGIWPDNGPTRVSVTREGNIFKIKTSQFGSTEIDENTLITIDLSLDERLDVFMTASKVAFAAKSQIDARFSDIIFTGLIDYIFYKKEGFYETYEFNKETENYELQEPQTVFASNYLGANRFVDSYLFNKIYFVTETDDLINIKGDGGISWDPNNAIIYGSDLRPFLDSRLIGDGGDGTIDPTVDYTYIDIDEMIANQNEQLEDDLIKVLDASADPNIESGKAYYFYNGTTAGTIEDYHLLSNAEIADLTSQAIINALGYTPANDLEVVKGVKKSDGTELVKDVEGKVTLPEIIADVHVVSVDTIWNTGDSQTFTVPDSAKVTNVHAQGKELRETVEWSRPTGTTIEILKTLTDGDWIKIESSATAVSTGSEGQLSSGVITLDLTAGRVYGDTTPLTGNLTIDETDAKIGGVATVYHNDSAEPSITPTIKKVKGWAYVTGTLNLISFSKIGSMIWGVCTQEDGTVAEDTEAPSVPVSLTSPSKTDTSVSLAWNDSTDNVGVTGYKIYVDDVFNKEVPENSGQVTGLTPETLYSFSVSAIDAAGNESAKSDAIGITTEAAATNFTPADISVETMWHKGDLATTDANAHFDTITTSTDSLTTTPYDLTAVNVRVDLKDGKDAFDVTQTSAYLTAPIPVSVYQSTYSIFMQIWAQDGQYTNNQFLLYTENSAGTSKLMAFLNTSGYLVIALEVNDVQVTATATDGIWANGDSGKYDNLDIIVNNGGLIEAYKNEVKLTLTNANTGLDIAQFSGVGYTSFGARKTDGIFDGVFDGYIRNIIVQPVAHTNADRTNLATL